MAPIKRKTSTKNAGKNPQSASIELTVSALETIAGDMKKRGVPSDYRLTITDKKQTGLRAIVRNTGAITFHVSYDFVDKKGNKFRPYLKIGSHPGITIAEARNLALTIRSLAEQGIDVQAGLHDRLVRELKEQGTKWRP